MSVTTAAAVAAEFAQAASKVDRKVATALRKHVHDVQGDAKHGAPVDTGNLRSSISVDIAPDGLSAEVGPEAEYGGYVEQGTYKMAPQPYLVPAAERRNDALMTALAEVADL